MVKSFLKVDHWRSFSKTVAVAKSKWFIEREGGNKEAHEQWDQDPSFANKNHVSCL